MIQQATISVDVERQMKAMFSSLQQEAKDFIKELQAMFKNTGGVKEVAAQSGYGSEAEMQSRATAAQIKASATAAAPAARAA